MRRSEPRRRWGLAAGSGAVEEWRYRGSESTGWYRGGGSEGAPGALSRSKGWAQGARRVNNRALQRAWRGRGLHARRVPARARDASAA